MKHKFFNKFLAGVLSCSLAVSGLFPVTAAAVQTTTPSRVSVEAPSLVKSGSTYYLFGSGMSDAKSSDLINWTQINSDYSSRDWTNDSFYGVVLENLKESFLWAGYDDGDYSGGQLNLRAPYVIWNPYYEWNDDFGSKGAYMLYYSASSTTRRSCIGYAVAKTVEGPYQYVKTILYSGFTTSGARDEGTGSSTRSTLWYNDYLNLKTLTNEGLVSGISGKWFDDNGNYNADYAPNAVDPMVFFDKDGNMKMVYGSGAGGLFLLDLYKSTGSPAYPSQDRTDSVSGNFVDKYFGTHISGKNSISGEAAFILYDEESDYYYLYESYGNSLGDGGYNMRLFRSKEVTGPYVDAKGNNAAENYTNTNDYGIKLMGNYQFTGQKTGYYSAGNNSAYIDTDGNHFLIFQQRFTGNIYTHQIRVHQQFMNDEGWPVTAVYEYRGETIGHYNESEVIGSYEIIDHGTETTPALASTKKIELLADGTVIGDMTGTWRKRTGTSYDYIDVVTGITAYHGVLFRQYNEDSSSASEVMTFSAIGNNNTSIFATRISAPTQSVINPDKPSSGSSGNSASQTSTSNTTTTTVNTSSSSLKKPSLTVKAGKKKATLTWKKIANAKGYQIQYAKNKAMKSAKKIKITKKATTKRVIKKLTSKKKYYFRIRAYAKKGSKTVYGKYSAKKSAKIK